MDDKYKEKIITLLLPILAAAIPLLARWLAWFIMVLIALTGVILSVNYSDWSIFSRAGSLIVVLALTLALIDYSSVSKNVINEARKIGGDKASNEAIENIKNMIMNDLKNHGVVKTDGEINYMAETLSTDYWERLPMRLGGFFKMQAVKTEITIAVIGTVIWGFGDLVGSILSK